MRVYQVWVSLPEMEGDNRLFLALFDTEAAARRCMRKVLKQGYTHGWILRGHEVLSYFGWGTPRIKRLIERCDAERGYPLPPDPFFRMELFYDDDPPEGSAGR